MEDFDLLNLPNPDWGYSLEPEVDVQEYKLGDGYVIREPKGLNYIRDVFSPTWSSLTLDEGNEAYAFLKPKLKWDPFWYTDVTTGARYKVICDSARLTYDEWNNTVLAVTLKQDFNP